LKRGQLDERSGLMVDPGNEQQADYGAKDEPVYKLAAPEEIMHDAILAAQFLTKVTLLN
jgi:hypothetical protein